MNENESDKPRSESHILTDLQRGAVSVGVFGGTRARQRWGTTNAERRNEYEI